MDRKKIFKCAVALVLVGVLAAAYPVYNLYAANDEGSMVSIHAKGSTIASLETFVKPQVTGPTKTVTMGEIVKEYTCVAESTDYRLYMEDQYLSLIVEDKNTGAYMSSAIEYDDEKSNWTWFGAMNSAIVITMINGSDDTKQADLFNDDCKKTISYTKEGFVAEIYFNKYKFGMTLQVGLTDEGLTATIPAESIHEDGDKYFLGTISIYPFMGNSYLEDKSGYMLAPDGNGALMYLTDKEGRYKNGFSGMIYGVDAGFVESTTETLLMDRYNTIEDPETVLAPVYGIAHTDDKMAYLAVVENGEARASVEVIPNGVSVDYNRAYAKYILRRTYTQPTSNNSTSGSLHVYEKEASVSDMTVRFLFLSGDKADYSGMAQAYRNYLLKNGELVASDVSYNTRVDFMGTERKNFLLGTTAVVMTTVDDVREIYDDLQANGVTEILSVYKGWQGGGLYNLPISRYSAATEIGSTGSLTKLIQEAAGEGIELYLYNDALLINPSTKNATFNVVKKVNKRKFEQETYMDVYSTMNYLTPTRSNDLLAKFVKSYTAKGVNNLAVGGITNTLFTYNYNSVKHTRYETQQNYADCLNTIKESTNLILEQPCAYLWKDTKAFLDMPLYTSNYVYEDESVPFLSMVLKGVIPVYSEYVNFEANKKEYFLKLVETGVYPSFYITKESSAELINTNSADIYSSEYSSYDETIAEYNKKLSELNAMTEGANIEKHEIVQNNVIRVTYSNGVTITVNYNDTAVNVGNITVEAMSYQVEK